jgi:phage protein D
MAKRHENRLGYSRRGWKNGVTLCPPIEGSITQINSSARCSLSVESPSSAKAENSTDKGHRDTSPTVLAKAKLCASSKLRQQNRKQNEFRLVLPLDLSKEAGQVCGLSGFTPDASKLTWTIHDVTHKMTAQSGSTTELVLHRPPTFQDGNSSSSES